MAYQVAKYCYADEASAADAACAQFAPVTAILSPGGDVRTVSCKGSEGPLLRLLVSTASPSSGQSQTTEITQAVAFPPCQEGELFQAWETIAAVLLSAWAVCYGGYKVYQFITISPRSGE